MSLAAQARRAAQLRYGPQADALSQLLGESGSDYSQQTKATRAGASALRRTLAADAGGTRADYAYAGSAGRGAESQVRSELGNSHSAAAQAALSEAIDSNRAVKLSQAQSLGDIRQRQADAAAGAVYAIRALTQSHAADVSKIGAQLQSVQGQAGSFAAQTYDQLLADKRKADAAAASAHETARHNSVTEGQGQQHIALEAARYLKNPSGGRGGKSGYLGAGPTASAIDAIGKAHVWANRLAHFPNGQLKSLLTAGGSIQVPTGQKDSKGQPKLRSISVPSFGSEIAQAGIDLHTYGSLQPHTVGLLHRRGIRVNGRVPYLTKSPATGIGFLGGALAHLFGG